MALSRHPAMASEPITRMPDEIPTALRRHEPSRSKQQAGAADHREHVANDDKEPIHLSCRSHGARRSILMAAVLKRIRSLWPIYSAPTAL